MGSKGSAPAPIDPYQSAGAQYKFGTMTGAYNAALNHVNTSGPGGSVNYNQTGVDPNTNAPIYSQDTTLSPNSQKIYDLGQSGQIQSGQNNLASGGLAGDLLSNNGSQLSNPLSAYSGVGNVNTKMDTSGVPGIAGAGDLAGFTNQARDAAYKQQTQYLDPQYDQQSQQLDARLRNSGAHPGDPAYDNAMKLFTNQKQQAYESAFNNANTQGLAEQNQLYNQSAGTNQQLYSQAANQFQAGNQAQGQQFSQAGDKLNSLYSALSNLRGGSSGSGQPGSSTGSSNGIAPGQTNVQAPDLQSAFNQNYQGQMNNYNADVSTANSNTAAGASTLAAIISLFSDRRLKKNIHRIGTSEMQLPIYRFHYLWDKDTEPSRVGVMAQDVERIIPEAVGTANGYKYVNYAMVR